MWTSCYKIIDTTYGEKLEKGPRFSKNIELLDLQSYPKITKVPEGVRIMSRQTFQVKGENATENAGLDDAEWKLICSKGTATFVPENVTDPGWGNPVIRDLTAINTTYYRAKIRLGWDQTENGPILKAFQFYEQAVPSDSEWIQVETLPLSGTECQAWDECIFAFDTANVLSGSSGWTEIMCMLLMPTRLKEGETVYENGLAAIFIDLNKSNGVIKREYIKMFDVMRGDHGDTFPSDYTAFARGRVCGYTGGLNGLEKLYAVDGSILESIVDTAVNAATNKVRDIFPMR
jgi:hypothetical protein